MSTASTRADLIESLKDVLPNSWRLLPYSKQVDIIAKTPVVLLRTKTVEKLSQAPQGNRMASYILTLVEPKTEPGIADDALDDKFDLLTAALDTLARTGLTWGTATAVIYGDTNPAYDIEISLPYKKEA